MALILFFPKNVWICNHESLSIGNNSCPMPCEIAYQQGSLTFLLSAAYVPVISPPWPPSISTKEVKKIMTNSGQSWEP